MGSTLCPEPELEREYDTNDELSLNVLANHLVSVLDESYRVDARSILIRSLKPKTGSEVVTRDSLRSTERNVQSAIVELQNFEELELLRSQWSSSSIAQSQARVERVVEDFWSTVLNEKCPLTIEIEIPDPDPFKRR